MVDKYLYRFNKFTPDISLKNSFEFFLPSPIPPATCYILTSSLSQSFKSISGSKFNKKQNLNKNQKNKIMF